MPLAHKGVGLRIHRVGPDQGHVPLQHVEQLRELVQVRRLQTTPVAGILALFRRKPIRHLPLCAELQPAERLSVFGQADLPRDQRIRIALLRQDGDHQDDRREHDQQQQGNDQVKHALDQPLLDAQAAVREQAQGHVGDMDARRSQHHDILKGRLAVAALALFEAVLQVVLPVLGGDVGQHHRIVPGDLLLDLFAALGKAHHAADDIALLLFLQLAREIRGALLILPAVDDQQLVGRIDVEIEPAHRADPGKRDQKIQPRDDQDGQRVLHKPPAPDQRQLQVAGKIKQQDAVYVGQDGARRTLLHHPEGAEQLAQHNGCGGVKPQQHDMPPHVIAHADDAAEMEKAEPGVGEKPQPCADQQKVHDQEKQPLKALLPVHQVVALPPEAPVLDQAVQRIARHGKHPLRPVHARVLVGLPVHPGGLALFARLRGERAPVDEQRLIHAVGVGELIQDGQPVGKILVDALLRGHGILLHPALADEHG